MPLLMIPYPAIDPVAVSLGPFAIRWYALAYIAGLLIGWRYCLALAEQPPHLGARAGHRRFPGLGDPGRRARRPHRLCAVLPARLLFRPPGPRPLCLAWRHVVPWRRARRRSGARAVQPPRQIRFFAFADIIACAVPIGLFFGRIANFINGELCGRADRRAVGDDLSRSAARCRAIRASSTRRLRGRPAVPAAVFRRAPRRAASPGIETGLFLAGYAVARMSGRAVPPARPAARLPDLWHDDGAAAVGAGARSPGSRSSWARRTPRPAPP